MSTSKHIDWIDLAKGFCILLVVYVHCKSDCYVRLGFGKWELLDRIGFLFRMPLYYFLSGLFFKDIFFNVLVKKKINKLLIPFAVFLLASVICKMLYKISTGQTWEGVFYPFMTIWFLGSLFIVNIYFFVLHKVTHNIYHLVLICFILGIMGYLFGKSDVNEYTHLTTSLTALPFFALGFLSNKGLNLISLPVRKAELFYSILCFTILVFICCFINGEIDYRINYYTVPIVVLYFGGIIGITGVILISRSFNKILLISYLGRYSIIVMITHYFFLQIIPYNIKMNIAQSLGGVTPIAIFVLIVALEIPTIWFCKKYFPYIFAQKDLIK